MAEKEVFSVYTGDEPYLFVSYAHRDSEAVLPLIRAMQAAGYRIWFDQGIEVGTEWSNNIAARLRGCGAFLFFASQNSVKSENCLDEVAYAKTHRKPALLAFLEEDVVLPEGTEMQTARFQRVYVNRQESIEAFVQTLTTASVLEPCREVKVEEPAPVEEPTPVVEEVVPVAVEAAPVAAETPAPKKKKKKWWIILIIAFAVFTTCCSTPLAVMIPLMMEDSSSSSSNYPNYTTTTTTSRTNAQLSDAVQQRVPTDEELVSALLEEGYALENDAESDVITGDEVASGVVYKHLYAGYRMRNLGEETFSEVAVLCYYEFDTMANAENMYEITLDELGDVVNRQESFGYNSARTWFTDTDPDSTDYGSTMLLSYNGKYLVFLVVDWTDYADAYNLYDDAAYLTVTEMGF